MRNDMLVKKGDLVRTIKEVAPLDAGVGLVLYTMHHHPMSQDDSGISAVAVWFAATQIMYTLDFGSIELVSSI